MGLSIVIPIAGRGQRFIDAGYHTPKPFLPVDGMTMLEKVVENVSPQKTFRLFFICRSEHVDEAGRIGQRIKQNRMCLSVNISPLDEIPNGAALTVRHGLEIVDEQDEILVANGDQIVDFSVDDFLENAVGASGQVAVFTDKAMNPKWSFAKLHGHRVVKIAEKDPISIYATCGIYWWAKRRLCTDSINRMIANQQQVKGEWYLAPAMNELRYVRAYFVNGMTGLGTPEDYEAYVNNSLLQRRSGTR